jgi:beta-lactamase class C
LFIDEKSSLKVIKIGLVGVGLLLLLFAIIRMPADIPEETSAQQIVVEEIPDNPYLVHFLDSLDIRIKESIEDTNVPGVAIAIVHNGKTVYKKAFGVKVHNSVAPVDTNTVFRLASVSKGFSSVLTGILVEDGVLSWNDKVHEILPWVSLKTKSQTDSLEIEHLLSHTAGLQYQAYTTLVEEGWDRDKIIKRLKDVNLISKVGILYSYQNVAYSIIEPVIEQLTGETFQNVMKERIFEPLNMQDASITYESFTNNENIAKPHLYRGRGRYLKIKISPTYYNVASAGGVNASISDMEEWLKTLTGHKPSVVPQPVLNKLFAPYVSTSSKGRAFRRIDRLAKAYYGLGWRILHLPQDTIVFHGGYANGYRSGIAISPKEDIGICVLTNSSFDLPGKTISAFFDFFYQQADSIKSWRYKNYF